MAILSLHFFFFVSFTLPPYRDTETFREWKTWDLTQMIFTVFQWKYLSGANDALII